VPFTVNDVRDLVQLLEQHPEWRAEVRRLVLTEELLGLPAVVRELADAQTRTEARIEELAQAQVRTEARLEELAQAQARTELEIRALAQAQARMQETQDRIDHDMHRMRDDLATLKGDSLQRRYRERPFGYFQQLIRGARLLTDAELREVVETAVGQGRLLPKEAQDLALADAVVHGRRQADGAEVYLVVEVSFGVGVSDVDRASRRAGLLARVGLPAWPVAAGQQVTAAARRLAAGTDVALLRGGQLLDQPPANGANARA
jgi:hypothetical protein